MKEEKEKVIQITTGGGITGRVLIALTNRGRMFATEDGRWRELSTPLKD